MNTPALQYLYLSPDLTKCAVLAHRSIDSFSERHKVDLQEEKLKFEPWDGKTPQAIDGVILSQNYGLLSDEQINLCRRLLRSTKPIYLYWPFEGAIEYLDRVRFSSLLRLTRFAQFALALAQIGQVSGNFRLKCQEKLRRDLVSPVTARLGRILQFCRPNTEGNSLFKTKTISEIDWERCQATELDHRSGSLILVTDDSDSLIQLISQVIQRPKRLYPVLRVKGEVIKGMVSVGLLSTGRSNWLGQRVFHQGLIDETILFDPANSKTVEIAIANHGLGNKSKIRFNSVVLHLIPWPDAEPETASVPMQGLNVKLDPNSPHTSILRSSSTLQELDSMIDQARPVALDISQIPTIEQQLQGTGVYLRLDFWAPISSGGSYGHTCYVAKNLTASTEHFIALMANRYTLMDEMGVNQNEIEPFTREGNEINLLRATEYYYKKLKSIIENMDPAYIYERICLGNYTGAKLSKNLGIPYIVEYNGSEISINKSFGGNGYQFEEAYLKAEDLAFKQAAIISVVSEVIRESLIDRGVDPKKILVNPNGVDAEDYSPADSEEFNSIRAELGFQPTDRVVGFSGTFGGWHGIDVLAKALPEIIQSSPHARFLLIGDGSYKTLIDEAVSEYSLQDKVISVGRVPQKEGARYLKACDILISPHSSHMIDSRFFGSPTKIFEYMAIGAGIVASDLEQIGEVLSPALSIKNDNSFPVEVENERSILVEPGNVEHFIAAVVHLIDHRKLSSKLGENAREAAIDNYTWEKHVDRLWNGLVQNSHTGELKAGDKSHAVESLQLRIMTNDNYKDEVQNQWNNDACGSHYVEAAETHTLQWYEEVEKYRYQQYAPWMSETMEFSQHAGETVLEIGAGIGTDLAQFALHGALVTDVDLSSGHLALAQENFKLRGLNGTFVHHDAEELPFQDETFDIVYTNGVIHHTPNTNVVIREIHRVLKPGGKAIVMVYAEHSLHYWYQLLYRLGVVENRLATYSIGEIMSQSVEISEKGARPLVKVYTARRLKSMFSDFRDVSVVKRQLMSEEIPGFLRWIPASSLGKLVGWNLVLKAYKPIEPGAK